MSNSVRFRKSGAGAGAGFGLREKGLAVLANVELKSSIMLLTMKIIENSISSLATGLSYLAISTLSKFLFEKNSTMVRSYHNKTSEK